MRRETQEAAGLFTTGECENMEGLFDLLADGDTAFQLQKSEVARQLGWFDEASNILSSISDPKFARVVSFIKQLIDDRDTRIRRVPDWRMIGSIR